MASESTIIALLGSQVLQKNANGSELVDLNELLVPGKVIGIYFSAHWCPPCRDFTPRLADWYAKLTGGVLKDKLEIIFVSSDKSEVEFDSYYKDMPWCALPYEHRTIKANVSKKYGIKGIPTFVLLDAATGKLITKNGRDIVDDDPNGESFPWTPKNVKELLDGFSNSLIDVSGETYNLHDITKEKHLALYFSASWCPPCKTFTPILVDLYNKMFSKLEVIYLSLDRDDASLTSSFQSMPWKSLNFADQQKHTSQIAQKFEIKGIPALVILNSDFNVLSNNARNILEKDTNFELFPWSSNTVRNLETELDFAYFISCPSIIVTLENKDDIEAATAQLKEYIDYFIAKREPDTLINGLVLHTKGELSESCKNVVEHVCQNQSDQIFFVRPGDQLVSVPEIKQSITLDEAKIFIDDYIQDKLEMNNFS